MTKKGIKMGLFLHTTKFHFCLICSPICLFHLVYRTLCRKPYFLRYRQLESDGVTIYDKGKGHKYCLKLLQKCVRHETFTKVDKTMSNGITMHLCNNRNISYKIYYRVILTIVFLGVFRITD